MEEPFSREFSEVTPEVFQTFCCAESVRKRLSWVMILPSVESRRASSGIVRTMRASRFASDDRSRASRFLAKVASSSRVRAHLMAGDVDKAARLLGREFFVHQGGFAGGDGRGRKLGFPTANLLLGEKLALPNGVYAGWSIFDGKSYSSITNIGVRPTFGKEGHRASGD